VNVEPDAELRAEIVRSRGLPPDAETFVVGSSIEEFERSADGLAALFAASGRQLEPQPSGATIADLRAAKAARQTALLRRFHAPSQQPRDEAGRFAGRSSWDGGARLPLRLPGNPEREHGEWLVGILESRSADAGRFL
jgi:hypothetical protein